MKTWLPQPMFSLFLWLVWLLLANSAAPGQMALGAGLAVALPLFTARFWPDRPRIAKPLAVWFYVAMFLWDIIVANLAVARLILGPTRRLRPAFITFPLDLTGEFAVTVLAHTISLTPARFPPPWRRTAGPCSSTCLTWRTKLRSSRGSSNAMKRP